MVSIMYVFLTVNCHAKIVGRSKWKKIYVQKMYSQSRSRFDFHAYALYFQKGGGGLGRQTEGGGVEHFREHSCLLTI